MIAPERPRTGVVLGLAGALSVAVLSLTVRAASDVAAIQFLLVRGMLPAVVIVFTHRSAVPELVARGRGLLWTRSALTAAAIYCQLRVYQIEGPAVGVATGLAAPPLVGAVDAILARRWPRPSVVAALGSALVAAVLYFSEADDVGGDGLMYAAASAGLSAGGQFALGRVSRVFQTPSVVLALALAMTAPGLAGASAAWRLDWPAAAALLVAATAGAGAQALFTRSFRALGPTKGSLLSSCSLPLTAAGETLLFSRVFTARQAVGLALIVLSTVFVASAARAEEVPR